MKTNYVQGAKNGYSNEYNDVYPIIATAPQPVYQSQNMTSSKKYGTLLTSTKYKGSNGYALTGVKYEATKRQIRAFYSECYPDIEDFAAEGSVIINPNPLKTVTYESTDYTSFKNYLLYYYNKKLYLWDITDNKKIDGTHIFLYSQLNGTNGECIKDYTSTFKGKPKYIKVFINIWGAGGGGGGGYGMVFSGTAGGGGGGGASAYVPMYLYDYSFGYKTESGSTYPVHYCVKLGLQGAGGGGWGNSNGGQGGDGYIEWGTQWGVNNHQIIAGGGGGGNHGTSGGDGDGGKGGTVTNTGNFQSWFGTFQNYASGGNGGRVSVGSGSSTSLQRVDYIYLFDTDDKYIDQVLGYGGGRTGGGGGGGGCATRSGDGGSARPGAEGDAYSGNNGGGGGGGGWSGAYGRYGGRGGYSGFHIWAPS